jgi:OOP family OmpA-OmpF porin
MKHEFILFSFILSTGLSCAQNNLISNGSFENNTICPNHLANAINNGNLVYTSNPNGGTPDYFNSCTTVMSQAYQVPSNFLGYQLPRSGTAYIGIDIWDKGYFVSEYIQIKLSENLKQNHHYAFECFLSRAEKSRYSISNFGVHFSIDSVFYAPFEILPLVPQIVNSPTNLLADTTDWMPVTGTFLANGGERFIILGNFNDSTQSLDTIYQYYGSANHYDAAYYYIDDVSLIDLDSTLSVKENEAMAQVEVFPNPASSILTIRLNAPCQQYSITDIKGNTLMQNSINKQEQIQIDITELPSGFYIINFINKLGYITREKFVKM